MVNIAVTTRIMVLDGTKDSFTMILKMVHSNCIVSVGIVCQAIDLMLPLRVIIKSLITFESVGLFAL